MSEEKRLLAEIRKDRFADEICRRGERPGYGSAPPSRQFGQKVVAAGFADGEAPTVTGASEKLN